MVPASFNGEDTIKLEMGLMCFVSSMAQKSFCECFLKDGWMLLIYCKETNNKYEYFLPKLKPRGKP